MTDDRPAPLTPADLDLRSLSYMPLHVERLLISETWLIATGDEAKAAMTLWCRAWHQVPAGSLPNDDRLLAALSGAGSKWKKVRGIALRGFTLCTDGRLYHTLLAGEAMEALEKRERWRKKKRRQREGQNEDVPGDNEGDIPEDTQGETALRDGTGRDKVNDQAPSEGARAREASQGEVIMTGDWQPSEETRAALRADGYGDVEIEAQRRRFVQNFRGVRGSDYDRRFYNWVTREPVGKYAKAASKADASPSNHADPWEARVASYRRDLDANKPRPFWPMEWGRPPGDEHCPAPAEVLRRHGFVRSAA